MSVRATGRRDQIGRTAARVASTSRAIWATSASSELEDRLVAEPLPQLDDEPLAVEVALEVEEERLDPPLRAAVVRVRADRDRGAVPERLARVDPVARADELRVHRDVGRRVAERPAALVAGDDEAVELERPAEHPARRRRGRRRARRRESRSTRRPRPPGRPARSSPSCREGLQVARPACSRSGSPRPPRPPPRRCRSGTSRRTRPGSSRMNSGVKGATSVSSDPRLGEQLEPPLERRDQLDAVPEHDARMRVERDHGRLEARVDRRARAPTRWPRWTPSNVPIATARGWRSSWDGACAILIGRSPAAAAPPRAARSAPRRPPRRGTARSPSAAA